MHVHVLSLHEILLFIDIPGLDLLVERGGSVLARDSGQRLSLVT